MAVDAAIPSGPALRAWLAERVATYVRQPVENIRNDVDLADYGLDSISALTVCTDIEDEFGVVIEPTALWDHNTVDALGELVLSQLPDAA